jgi:hypothetical protein
VRPHPPAPQAHDPPAALSLNDAPFREEPPRALNTESCNVCRPLEQLGQTTSCVRDSTICS